MENDIKNFLQSRAVSPEEILNQLNKLIEAEKDEDRKQHLIKLKDAQERLIAVNDVIDNLRKSDKEMISIIDEKEREELEIPRDMLEKYIDIDDGRKAEVIGKIEEKRVYTSGDLRQNVYHLFVSENTNVDELENALYSFAITLFDKFNNVSQSYLMQFETFDRHGIAMSIRHKDKRLIRVKAIEIKYSEAATPLTNPFIGIVSFMNTQLANYASIYEQNLIWNEINTDVYNETFKKFGNKPSELDRISNGITKMFESYLTERVSKFINIELEDDFIRCHANHLLESGIVLNYVQNQKLDNGGHMINVGPIGSLSLPYIQIILFNKTMMIFGNNLNLDIVSKLGERVSGSITIDAMTNDSMSESVAPKMVIADVSSTYSRHLYSEPLIVSILEKIVEAFNEGIVDALLEGIDYDSKRHCLLKDELHKINKITSGVINIFNNTIM